MIYSTIYIYLLIDSLFFKDSDDKSSKLIEPAVLTQFSREYDRVLELGLEDVGQDQLIDLLLAPDKDKLDAWKVEAYLGKLWGILVHNISFFTILRL